MMKNLSYRLAIILFSAVILNLAGLATVGKTEEKGKHPKNSALSTQQRKEVQQIIDEYLRANPRIIVDSIRAMQDRQNKLQQKRVQQKLDLYKEIILNDPSSPVAGNPRGNVTIVEFLDYFQTSKKF